MMITMMNSLISSRGWWWWQWRYSGWRGSRRWQRWHRGCWYSYYYFSFNKSIILSFTYIHKFIFLFVCSRWWRLVGTRRDVKSLTGLNRYGLKIMFPFLLYSKKLISYLKLRNACASIYETAMWNNSKLIALKGQYTENLWESKVQKINRYCNGCVDITSTSASTCDWRHPLLWSTHRYVHTLKCPGTKMRWTYNLSTQL